MSIPSRTLLASLFLSFLPLAAEAQEPAQPAAPSSAQPAPGTPAYTLHAATHIVLTDVTVSDRDGNAVRNLPRSAFHIFDNDRSQPLSSYEEHSTPPVLAAAASSPHVFSNNFLLHPPSVFNAVMLDITNLSVVDQMYLYKQLTDFIKALPAGAPLAIYFRGGEQTLLLQTFTADHALLLSALGRAIPQLPQPDGQYASDLTTLHQLTLNLGQLPGRKNVLWFSGGSNLFLRADASQLPAYANLQPIYDELEASRIAIYPIDARGLEGNPGVFNSQQHFLMQDVAEATGGQAFYNTNGLALVAAKVLRDDASFYTLSYTPHDLRFDNKWHRVKVTLDHGSPYTLRYRHGYFDDGANVEAHQSKTLLLADGAAAHMPETRSQPIIFNAEVLPLVSAEPPPSDAAPNQSPPDPAPKRNETTYSVEYTLPAASFLQQTKDGRQQVTVGTALLAFNRFGRPVERVTRKVIVGIDEAKLESHPGGVLNFRQQINLPKGEDYLWVAVWDYATGRLGSIQLPLQVAHP